MRKRAQSKPRRTGRARTARRSERPRTVRDVDGDRDARRHGPEGVCRGAAGREAYTRGCGCAGGRHHRRVRLPPVERRPHAKARRRSAHRERPDVDPPKGVPAGPAGDEVTRLAHDDRRVAGDGEPGDDEESVGARDDGYDDRRREPKEPKNTDSARPTLARRRAGIGARPSRIGVAESDADGMTAFATLASRAGVAPDRRRRRVCTRDGRFSSLGGPPLDEREAPNRPRPPAEQY